jgi:DNA-binding transcriptional ArsR family regulator
MAGLNEVFHALSDPTRRQIVRLLRAGRRSAGEIAQEFPLAKSTLSAHFKVLKQAGLIEGERKGTTIVYRLNTSALREVVRVLASWLDSGAEQPAPAAAGTRPAGPPHAREGRWTQGGQGSTRRATGEAAGPTRSRVLRGGLLLLAARLAGLGEPVPVAEGAGEVGLADDLPMSHVDGASPAGSGCGGDRWPRCAGRVVRRPTFRRRFMPGSGANGVDHRTSGSWADWEQQR